MWSARDGATKPYKDVFTGVFWKASSQPLPAPIVETPSDTKAILAVYRDNAGYGMITPL